MNPFKLEEYFSIHEFTAKYLLCSSDAESLSMKEVLAMASDEEKSLWDNLKLGYTECPGLPKLREAIAKNLYSMNLPVLVFTGAEEGIFCALNVLLAKGDHAIVLSPCYQSLAEIPRSTGALVKEVELLAEDDFKVDIKRIEQAILPSTKVLVINFPHNPTGQVISEEELKSLVALCRKHDLWLFSDEAYRPLGEPAGGFSMPAAEAYSKALSLGVMSKAFSLPGLRIGWIACQDQAILKKIQSFKNYTTICNSAPAEILALIALNNYQKILDRNNQIINSNLKLLDKFFVDHTETFSWVRPQAGCVGFVRYLKGDAEQFCADLLAKKNVLLLPGSIYNYPKDYFRIGFGRSNMPESLALLNEYLAED